MLSWQQHARSATVMLFPMEHRHTAYVTLGLISRMIRSFMVGNLLIGLLMAAVSVSVFGALHLPFFLLVGVMSGFLSLVPYLGIVLALLPPLMVGLGQLESSDLAALSIADARVGRVHLLPGRAAIVRPEQAEVSGEVDALRVGAAGDGDRRATRDARQPTAGATSTTIHGNRVRGRASTANDPWGPRTA